MKILNCDVPLPSASMAASITGTAVSIEQLAHVTVFTSYAGSSPTGTITVETAPTDAGPWFVVDTNAITADGSKRIALSNLGDAFLRVKYTRTSGSGTLSAQLTAKGW